MTGIRPSVLGGGRTATVQETQQVVATGVVQGCNLATVHEVAAARATHIARHLKLGQWQDWCVPSESVSSTASPSSPPEKTDSGSGRTAVIRERGDGSSSGMPRANRPTAPRRGVEA